MKTSNYIRFIATAVLLLQCTLEATAQLPHRPAITNFTPKQYKAHSQVFCAATDKAGRAYFGTADEIFIYDGASWSHVPVGAGNYIVSMDLDTASGIIYAGGSGEFGYIAPTGKYEILNASTITGALEYVSLTDKIPPASGTGQFSSVWETHATRFGIVFNAYSHLFLYQPETGKMEVFLPDSVYNEITGRQEQIPPASGTGQAGSAKKENTEKLNTTTSGLFFSSFYAPALVEAGGTAPATGNAGGNRKDTEASLYIQHDGLGILTFDPNLTDGAGGTAWELLPGTKTIVKEGRIYALHPVQQVYPDATGEAMAAGNYTGLLLYVKPGGFYRYDKAAGQVYPGVTGADTKLPDFQDPGGLLIRIGQYVRYNPSALPYNAALLSFSGIPPLYMAGTRNDGIVGLELTGPGWMEEGSNGAGGMALTPLFHLSKKEGLSDNHIWNQLYLPAASGAMEAAPPGAVWLCTDNGISRLEFPSPLGWYGYNEGIDGGIESIAIMNENTPVADVWLATTQGCYYSAAGRESKAQMTGSAAAGSLFQKVPGIESQCFNIRYHPPTGRLILAAGNAGLYSIQPARKQVGSRPQYGRSSLRGKQSAVGKVVESDVIAEKILKANSYGLAISHRGAIFTGSSDGLYRAAQRQGRPGWESKQLLSNKDIREIVNIVTRPLPSDTRLTEVWAGTFYEGVHRLLVNEHGNVTGHEHYQAGREVPEGYTGVFPWKSPDGTWEVMVCTKNGLYEAAPLNPPKGGRDTVHRVSTPYRFIPCTRFGEMFADTGRDVSSFSQAPNGDVWMVSKSKVVHCKLTPQGAYMADTIPFLSMDIGASVIYPAQDGLVWIGGNDGLLRYNPSVVLNYERPYPCMVTEVRAPLPQAGSMSTGHRPPTKGGKPGVIRDTVLYGGFGYNTGTAAPRVVQKQPAAMAPVLPYDMNNFTFRFAAPFYVKEEKTQYSFFLEGTTKDWSPWSTETKTNFTNLDPGKYTFRVKAKNVYGHESAIGEYRFRILPPWWLTWWFYALQGGVLFGLFCIILMLRGTGEKRQKLIKVLAYMFIFLVLEYAQNYTEEALASYITGIVILKIVLNVSIGALLIPFEGFVLRIARATARLKVKTQRDFSVKMLTKRVENTIVKKARKDERYEITGKMLAKGSDIQFIAEVTGLSLARVRGLM